MKQDNPLPGAPHATDFLTGGGKMGALIRAHDWSNSIGPPQGWPQSLRTVVRLMLTTHHPMFVFWGSAAICLYNDAYISLIGPELHPTLLGAPGRLIWDTTIWTLVEPQIARVMSGQGATWHEDQCIPLFRHGALDEAYFTYGYSPIDDESAPHGVGGVLVICAETTQKVLFGKHQTFRLQLEAALRYRSRPADIIVASTRLLGEFLEASRCCYFENAAGSEELQVRHDWTRPGTPHLGERIHMSELGSAFRAWHRNERTLPVAEPAPAQAGGGPREFLGTPSAPPSGTAAAITKDGQLLATLCVYPGGRCRWTEQHHALIRDVAERVWEAVEHARAAVERDRAVVALRHSEARYRSLVEASATIVWELPASGEFAQPQPGWSAYTGQSFEELQGWGWLNAVHPEDQDTTAEALGRAFETHSNFELRYRLRSRDGEYRPMLIRAVAMSNSDGTLNGWIGIHTDLSAERAPLLC